VSSLQNLFQPARRFIRREVVPIIADLRLAIVLLLAIALFSIAGTVIEQGSSVQFYMANYPEKPALFGFLTWKVILAAGLDHVYRTWWFLSLLILFGTSLTACTWTRQLPALRWFSRTWNFYTQPRQFQKFTLSAELTQGTMAQLIPLLEQRRYKVFQEGQSLYAHKGIVGRIGPILVHASMLIILIGSMIGAMTGFIAQEMVPSGEAFQVRHLIDAGPWSGNQVPQDWSVKVNRFWIDYTPAGDIDQFYSDLSVLDQNQNEVDRQTIHVNKPLKHRGVTFYQADWGIAGIRLKINNSPVLELPMIQLPDQGRGRFWGTFVPTNPANPESREGISLITNDLQGTLFAYDKTGQMVSTVRQGTATEIDGFKVTVVELIGSTGLQVKADPGIPIVYLGFGLIMVGVMMSYVSHSQVWALEHSDRFYVGGRTNRAQVVFEREVLEILEQLDQPQVPSPSTSDLTTTPA
jgi:cytochrome c biogenesis protein